MSLFRCTINPIHEVNGILPRFCTECGAPVIAARCGCGFLILPDNKFCPECGKRILAANPTPAFVSERTQHDREIT